MAIRSWAIQDLPDVNALLGELSKTIGFEYHGSLEMLRRHFDESERHPDFYSTWVYVDNGTVSGFLSAVCYGSVLHRKGTALINELVVSEGSRGKGIGRELLQHFVSDAAARGFDEVEVGAVRDNDRAIAFYRRNGFDEEYVLLGRELTRPPLSGPPPCVEIGGKPG